MQVHEVPIFQPPVQETWQGVNTVFHRKLVRATGGWFRKYGLFPPRRYPGPSYGGVGPESSGGVWGLKFEGPRVVWSVWARRPSPCTNPSVEAGSPVASGKDWRGRSTRLKTTRLSTRWDMVGWGGGWRCFLVRSLPRSEDARQNIASMQHTVYIHVHPGSQRPFKK